MATRKPIIGIAGGIGSGKSAVAKILAELGAGLIDSDAINGQELEQAEVRSTLVQWWGDRILTPDGRVDRARVAEIVFADAAEKNRLEALMHPRIAVQRRRLIEEFEGDPKISCVVLDAPLLFEVGLDQWCDAIVFVEADEEVRFTRTAAARGWSREEFHRRERMQSPLDFKRARADYVCRNNSDPAALRQQVEALFSQIVAGTNARA